MHGWLAQTLLPTAAKLRCASCSPLQLLAVTSTVTSAIAQTPFTWATPASSPSAALWASFGSQLDAQTSNQAAGWTCGSVDASLTANKVAVRMCWHAVSPFAPLLLQASPSLPKCDSEDRIVRHVDHRGPLDSLLRRHHHPCVPQQLLYSTCDSSAPHLVGADKPWCWCGCVSLVSCCLQVAYMAKRQSDLLPSQVTPLPCASTFPGMPGAGAAAISSITINVRCCVLEGTLAGIVICLTRALTCKDFDPPAAVCHCFLIALVLLLSAQHSTNMSSSTNTMFSTC